MLTSNQLNNAVERTMLQTQKLQTTKKMLDVLAYALHIKTKHDLDPTATPFQRLPSARVITLEGVVRSSKTVMAILIFHYLVQRSGAKFHLIAGRDYESIRRNILDAELGLITMFPEYYSYKKDEIGGYYIEARCSNGIKQILIAGYADTTKWKKILGGSLENILVDEVNIADQQFIKECFARQVSALHPVTVYTLNGDNPGHEIYTDVINHSLIVGDCPVSTRIDMDAETDKKAGYYYFWWSFEDNPAMSKKQIQDTKTLYPAGSYYHKTRILGERGRWGALIFADYMSKELIVDVNEKDAKGKPIYDITSYGIGMDVAGDKAYNVIALVGFNKRFSRAWLVDIAIFDNKDRYGTKVGYDFITKRLLEFLNVHQLKAIRYIAIDNAVQAYINDLNGRKIGIEVIASYKATILVRIGMNCLLFSRGRFQFHNTTIVAYQAFQAAQWTKGKEGKEREDKGEMINDIMDAVEYAETPYITALTTGMGG